MADGGTTTQHSVTNPFAPGSEGLFNNQVLPLADKMTAAYDPTGGVTGKAVSDYYQGELGGNNLYGNPALDNYINATGKEYTKMASGAANMASGNAARSGMLGSTSAEIMRNSAAQDVADKYATVASGARLNNYNTERGYQNQAASALNSLDQQKLSNLMTVLGIFQQGGTTDTTGSKTLGTMDMIEGATKSVGNLGSAVSGKKTP